MAKHIINKHEPQSGRILVKHRTPTYRLEKKSSNRKMTKHMTEQFIGDKIRTAKKYKTGDSKSRVIK